MQVNPGDPITSELLASIVANINIINTMSNSVVSSTAGSGSDGATTPTSAQVIESGRIKVSCNTSGTGKKTITFTKSFTARPNIVCTIWQPSAANFLKHKYTPIVTAASSTEFTVQMLPVGATANGDVWVQWIAAT